jgi:hypothetical protein
VKIADKPLVRVWHLYCTDDHQETNVMKSVFEETDVEKGAAGASCGANCRCGQEAADLAKRLEKGVNDAKAAVSAKLEDGKIAAERLVKRGRYAVEDGISEAAHNIKRHPFGSLAMAFAAGAALAFLVPRATKR